MPVYDVLDQYWCKEILVIDDLCLQWEEVIVVGPKLGHPVVDNPGALIQLGRQFNDIIPECCNDRTHVGQFGV